MILLTVLVGGAGAGYFASSSDVVRISDVPRIGEGVSIPASNNVALPENETPAEEAPPETRSVTTGSNDDTEEPVAVEAEAPETPDPSQSPEPSKDSTTADTEDAQSTDEGRNGDVPDSAPAPAPAGSGDTDESSGSSADSTASAGLQLVNSHRAEAGCPAVTSDDRLIIAAQRHADDMAAHDYFSHVSQDGRTFDERIRAAGYDSPGAENIAAGQQDVDAVMAAWMDSPGHRANILNCDLGSVGLARSGNVWVQTFGY